MENTSGQGKDAVVPEEVKGLAWGAFLWTWLWGIFNRTWLALLVLVPIVGLVMWVMLLLKGREWAWRNKRWDSVEHFNRVQRKWTIFGLVFALAIPVLGIIAAIVIPMLASTKQEMVSVPPAPPKPAVRQRQPTAPAVVAPPVAAPAPAVSVVEKPSASADSENRLNQSGESKQAESGESTPTVNKTKTNSEAKSTRSLDRANGKGGLAATEEVEAMPEPPVHITYITPKFNDLVTAIMYRDQAAVTQLLDLGWWVEKPNAQGITPIMEAVLMGDTEMAELLLKRGANPNAFARDTTALQEAKSRHDAGMEALLRRYGATGE